MWCWVGSEPPSQHQICGQLPSDDRKDRDQMIENLWGQILLITYFIPIFTVGMAGNIWVIVSVFRILHRGKWSPINNTFQHMAMYILSLSIADVAVLCMVPMLLGYFLDGHWRFGLIGCKVFFTVENINKLLSVAILTVMSFERFAAVSRPFRRRLFCRVCPRRTPSQSVWWVVLCLLITSMLLCSPIIYYAELKPLQLSYDDGSSESSTQMVCGSDLPDHVMSFFICYMFVLGFVLPLLFISLCYFFLIQHLRKASANFECWPRGQGMFVTACFTNVVRSVLRVVGFHMICWGPFWVFVLIPIIEYFQLSQMPKALDTEFSRNIRMASSFLPYLNSAGNWIFYAAMNREMRDTVTVLWPSASNVTVSMTLRRQTTSDSLLSRHRRPAAAAAPTAAGNTAPHKRVSVLRALPQSSVGTLINDVTQA